MNKKICRCALVASLLAVSLCCCDLDKDEKEEVQSLQFVTIESVMPNSMNLRLDNGELINVELGESTAATTPAAGTRSIALYRQSPTPHRLYSIAEVPVETIETMTDENADTFGNDSTYYMNLCYTGADYLNVYFSSRSSKKEMKLIHNPDIESTADTAYLALRYNANSDNSSANSSKAISFKLEELRHEGKDSVVIFVDAKLTDATGKFKNKRYNFIQKWQK